MFVGEYQKYDPFGYYSYPIDVDILVSITCLGK